MKIKSLAMLAMTGLTLSFAYIAPAIAEDSNPTAQPNGMNDSSMQIAANSASNAANNATAATQNDATNNVGTPEDGTPDTATGDDDY